MGGAAHAAPQLRYPSAGAKHRHSRDSSLARACQARHDGALHPGGHQPHSRSHESAGPAHAARTKENSRSANDVAGRHGPPSCGGRGHLPRPRGRVASRQPRPRQPRPAQGDERHRELPHGSPREPSAHGLDPWRPCGTLRGLRPYNDRLQQLPQSALPQMPEPALAKAGGAAAREWMAARQAELLPVPYFHVVFTLPVAIGDIAYHNKAMIYDLLFTASAETMLTIAADPKHLGARIGITSVLHSWGSAMTHHPHVHMIVPGGGLARDGSRWVPPSPTFACPCACSRSCSAG